MAHARHAIDVLVEREGGRVQQLATLATGYGDQGGATGAGGAQGGGSGSA